MKNYTYSIGMFDGNIRIYFWRKDGQGWKQVWEGKSKRLQKRIAEKSMDDKAIEKELGIKYAQLHE